MNIYSRSGSTKPKTVEKDFGSTPVFTGVFTITDSAIKSTSIVIIEQAFAPLTGKGTLADENEMDGLVFYPTPFNGYVRVRWKVAHSVVSMELRRAGRSPKSLLLPANDAQFSFPKVLGRVKGNFKMNYLVY